MKVYVEMSYFKEEDYQRLINQFNHVDFTNNLDDSYDATHMISMPGYLKKENLDLYKNLTWVMVLTAGFDTLDLDYFRKRQLTLVNSKDVFSTQIAEDIFAKILHFNRNYGIYHEQKKEHLWKSHPVHFEIAESTVGIIGTGSIGLEVAKRMKAFGAKTLGYRQKNEELPFIDELYTSSEGLNKIYAESDYLIVSIPLNEQTKNFIDEKAISLMKKSALFINVARGKVVDQNALINALKHHHIRGAGLDVTTPEPLPENSELWTLENVFITPHNASSSPHVRNRLINVVIETLNVYFKGNDYPNRVI
jgi:phosphoglycerate dehydrogenase-like enzyme